MISFLLSLASFFCGVLAFGSGGCFEEHNRDRYFWTGMLFVVLALVFGYVGGMAS